MADNANAEITNVITKGLEEVKESLDKKLVQTLKEERETHEKMLAAKAEGKAVSELEEKLAKLEARNLTRDHIFSGRHLRVHARLYAYWSGSMRYDRMGVGLTLLRVGVKF